jgi:hypothetical protein
MDLQNEPLVALHIALLRVLTDEQEEAHFHTAITLLNAHYALLNPYEQRDRYLVVINYAIRKINKGEIIYFQKTLDFYKTLLENKTLLQNNILQVWDYKNIITAGLRVENYDWVETFLYEYNEKLPDSFRENALNYNLAKLNFDRKNYKKVIDLLQIVEYSDFTYIFGSRSTLLKTYYELGEYEAMESAAESFRLFLLRNKTASINTKKSYQNFIRFIKKAIKIPINQPLLREKLIANIHETSLIADKKWLLEKLTDKITDKI